jgi:hypothetical protein
MKESGLLQSTSLKMCRLIGLYSSSSSSSSSSSRQRWSRQLWQQAAVVGRGPVQLQLLLQCRGPVPLPALELLPLLPLALLWQLLLLLVLLLVLITQPCSFTC